MRWKARFSEILMVDVVSDTRTGQLLIGPDERVLRFGNAEEAEREARRQNDLES